MSSPNVNVKEVRKFIGSHPSAKYVLYYYKNRKRHTKQTDLSKVLKQLHDEGVPISGKELRETFNNMENIGLGKIDLKSNGRVIFMPNLNMVKVSKAVDEVQESKSTEETKAIEDKPVAKIVIFKGTLKVETTDKEEAIKFLQAM